MVGYPNDIVLPKEPAYRLKQLQLLMDEYQARKRVSAKRTVKYLNFKILVLQDLITSGTANFEHTMVVWRLMYTTDSLSQARETWDVLKAYAENGGIDLDTRGRGSLDQRFPPEKLK